MNREFLAKSNPRETIQEHTDKLLKNLNTLQVYCTQNLRQLRWRVQFLWLN